MVVRWAGHASLPAGGSAICGAFAGGGRHGQCGREGEKFLDPGRVSHRMGAGRWILWEDWRSAGAQPGVESDDPDVRDVYGIVVLRPDMVAAADLPLSGRVGDRWRMGGRLIAAVGDLAKTMAGRGRG